MKMQEIAEKTGLTFHGGDDTRLFADDDKRIDVFAPALGAVAYRKMEKRINDFEIKREKYSVYVWNDVSGYSYWKKDGECNYIQVTANITNSDLNEAELKQLKADIESAYEEFYEFHTLDEYCDSLSKRGA